MPVAVLDGPPPKLRNQTLAGKEAPVSFSLLRDRTQEGMEGRDWGLSHPNLRPGGEGVRGELIQTEVRDALLTSTLRPHLDLCLPRTALPQKSGTPPAHSDPNPEPVPQFLPSYQPSLISTSSLPGLGPPGPPATLSLTPLALLSRLPLPCQE